MSEELGKIEKPTVESFGKARKLLFIPLIFSPPEPESDFFEIVRRYWDEVESHVAKLELKLGNVSKIYHELVAVGGEEGANAIEELNSASYRIIQTRLEKGAELQLIEDFDLLTEFMDWSRCLAIGFQNQDVFNKIYESYLEARSKRNKDIADRIDESLPEGDIGIVLMREGHQVQFPQDVEVFYVAPPGLDEIKRWLRDRERKLEAELDNDSEE
ncbi:MAG: hypothetical protein SVO26_07665 [Chloroflexota bacterium]|nr:hypothetical protein [Chloroflexota bacterium]